jgi:hypothetical protein
MTKLCKFEGCEEDAAPMKKGFCDYHYACDYHSKKKPSNGIPNKSKKQLVIDAKVADIKSKLMVIMKMKCQGCGSVIKSRSDIELSHLIRRSQRSDLVTKKMNCTLHGKYCGCHEAWDSLLEEPWKD